MKKLFLLALFSLATQAAEVETCLKMVRDNCGTGLNDYHLRNLSRSQTECKVVNGGNREYRGNSADGTRFDRKIVFFDNNSIVSVRTPEGNISRQNKLLCDLGQANISGRMVETKASSGRLYIASSSGALYAISRTNTIHEILNRSSRRYNWITGLGVDGTSIYLKGNMPANTKSVYSLEEMSEAINNRSRSVCLGNCNAR